MSTAIPPPPASTAPIGDFVASHYNNLDEKGLEQRKDSRIFHMRNLNNWIKSQLINEYMDKIRQFQHQQGHRGRINVLDLGCGKGGDLLKWSKARVDHVVCCDIAATSINQCEDRYREMRSRNPNQRLFSAEFHTLDCTKGDLEAKLRDRDMQFDLVSCQFAFHYCFESLEQADRMLSNVSKRLKPGGYFIGTTPDAYDIVDRLSKTDDGKKIGNAVFGIDVDDDLARLVKEDPSKIPLFGAKYNFHLEGVVDCPEFLVHFPTLVKLADERHSLTMVAKRRFGNYFTQYKERGSDLLSRMNALETYPPMPGVKLVGEGENDYEHAKACLESLPGDGDDSRQKRIGTLSLDEWEAAKIYVIFAFKKMK